MEYARDRRTDFDLHHLGLYVEALIEKGNIAKAFPLLTDALKERPRDPRLNYRMGEILRDQGKFDEAKNFATIALDNGAHQASLTLANIAIEEAKEQGILPKDRSKLRLFGQFRGSPHIYVPSSSE